MTSNCHRDAGTASLLAAAAGALLLAACAPTEVVPEPPYNPRIELVVAKAEQAPDPTLRLPASTATMDPGDNLVIHSLNVGAGSCHVLACPGPGQERIVFDCGSIDATPTAMTAAQVSQAGNDLLGSGPLTVVASHPDQDHYDLLHELVGSRAVQSIWLGGDIDRYGTQAFVDWLVSKQDSGTPVYHDFPAGYANAGLPLADISCGSASVWLLTANVGDSKNANSVGMLLSYKAFKVLLPGDAQDVTQDSIIENYGALTEDVTLLFGSHHGSSSHGSNKGQWPAHTNPEIIVYSSGDKFRHPKCNIVGNYRNRLMASAAHPVWCNPRDDATDNTTTTVTMAEYVTEVNGAVAVETDGDTVSVTCSKQPGGCF